MTHEKILLAKTRIVEWNEPQSDLATIEAAGDFFDETQLELLIKNLVQGMTWSPTIDNVIYFDEIMNLER